MSSPATRVSVAPWCARLREPSLREVDRDDPLRAGEPAADHGAEADEAAAEDDARRAGLDPRRVERGADPGREPAGERGAAVERRLGADLRERDLGHHGVLGERRGAHEVPQRLAVAREPRGAVGEVAEALLVADRDAAVGAVAEAVDALPALGGEERDHVVAGRDERDAVTDALDDAGTLVAEHAGRVAGRVGAGGGVEVGVADAAGGEPDEHLARLRLGEIDLLDDERAAELLEDCGADLHGASTKRPGGRPSHRRLQHRGSRRSPRSRFARACSSGVTPSLSPIDRSAPAATSRRTISWWAGPPSPRITASSSAVQPRSLTWSTSTSVRVEQRPHHLDVAAVGRRDQRRAAEAVRPASRRDRPARTSSSTATSPVSPSARKAFARVSSWRSTSAPAATSSLHRLRAPGVDRGSDGRATARVRLVHVGAALEQVADSRGVAARGRVDERARLDGWLAASAAADGEREDERADAGRPMTPSGRSREQPLVERERLRRGDVPAEALDGPRATGAAHRLGARRIGEQLVDPRREPGGEARPGRPASPSRPAVAS